MNLKETLDRTKQIMGLLNEDAAEEKLASVQPEVQSLFQKIQSDFGEPLTITSGLRDPKKNTSVGGAKKSAHLTGLALDLQINKPTKEKMLKLINIATKNGVLGLGVYKNGSVLHVDLDTSKGKRAWGDDFTSKTIPTWASSAVQNHLSGNSFKLN